jgi:hypothetical protein
VGAIVADGVSNAGVRAGGGAVGVDLGSQLLRQMASAIRGITVRLIFINTSLRDTTKGHIHRGNTTD